MIKVKVKSQRTTQSELILNDALANTLKKELNGASCDCCEEDSIIEINIQGNKINSISTKITACCADFKKKIEDKLYKDDYSKAVSR